MPLTHILENLYIGGYGDMRQTSELLQNKITHILTVDQRPLENTYHDGFTYKHLVLLDLETEDLLSIIPNALEFLELGRKDNNAVVVHCQAGQSRSGAIIIAYLMSHMQLGFDEAYTLSRKLKADVIPNDGFIVQLQLFEDMGWKIDKEHPAYRLYSLNRISMLVQSGYSIEAMKREVELSPASSDESKSYVTFKCRKCRTLLFNGSHILTHPAGAGQIVFIKPWANSKGQRGDLCQASLFIAPVKWMEHQNIFELAGKLMCPKCVSKVGSWAWTGEQCTCGNWITPAFHIDKKKVDKSMDPNLSLLRSPVSISGEAAASS